MRVTLQPRHYAYVPINTENKHFLAYSKGKASELLLTDNFVCITFTISEKDPRQQLRGAGLHDRFHVCDGECW
ncbi:MAG: hypothetical protein QXV49_01670 [Conexivisphaerales archaeon]